MFLKPNKGLLSRSIGNEAGNDDAPSDQMVPFNGFAQENYPKNSTQ
jgi:hypothetical protein